MAPFCDSRILPVVLQISMVNFNFRGLPVIFEFLISRKMNEKYILFVPLSVAYN